MVLWFHTSYKTGRAGKQSSFDKWQSLKSEKMGSLWKMDRNQGFTVVVLPVVSYHTIHWQRVNSKGLLNQADGLQLSLSPEEVTQAAWADGYFWCYLARRTRAAVAAGGIEITCVNLLQQEGPWDGGCEEHGLWSHAGLGQIFVLLPVSSMSLEIYLTSLGLSSLICVMGITAISIS